ncbi:hypothetical protein [Neobacillus thermocopriae]|uniref:hypothetical protein n=1 Tax=Neobacillus thermocopriae TaxID=1215031 RepID=UPI002E1DCDE8|nr:hypothetical protein [Neobacillus thermocopriae]MED3713806.1 hypothetical protein [Neobacillus thermocopriae]
MINQPFNQEKNQKSAIIYHYKHYKRNRPYFTKPVKITVDEPINGTYFMIKNLVYNQKQILVLKNERSSNTIILVEAKFIDGKLKYLSRLSDELVSEISKLLVNSAL